MPASLGGDGGNLLAGNIGNDWLLGGGSNDRMKGLAGDDFRMGGAGNDRLSGGIGNDRMAGNGGADVFLFDRGTNRDVVLDFQHRVDRLELDAGLWTGTLTAAQVVRMFAHKVGANVVFDFGEDSIQLNGITSLAGLAGDILIV